MKKGLLLGFCLSLGLSAAGLAPAFAGQEAAQAAPGSAPVSNPPSAGAKRPTANSEIAFKDGQLTVNFKKLALSQLADDLSQKAGIAVIVAPDAAVELVSASFENTPLDAGLRQILSKQDAFFFYGVDENKSSTLKAVWIFSQGGGRGLAPVPPDKWASTKDLYTTLNDKDPTVRGQAVETLIARKRQGAQEPLLTALHDSSGQVRSRALYAAMKSAVDVPPPVLEDLALHDSSADVRFLALEALADNPDARSTAEGALKDSNEAVRNAAQAIIAKSNGASGDSEPSPQSINQPQTENSAGDN